MSGCRDIEGAIGGNQVDLAETKVKIESDVGRKVKGDSRTVF